MRRLIAIVGLEGYAVLLAWGQFLQHVRTDEAKYLLNIPYPHPPLVRAILGLMDGWTHQEIFWRVVFATMTVQAVWFVWNMGKGMCKSERMLLALCWLLAGGVMLQAGAVLMAPLTALQMLFFAWLYVRDDIRLPAGLIGLLWLASLFTAFQAVLFAPLVWVILRRSTSGAWERAACFALPIGLLALYALGNPLALASMVIHTEREGVTLLSRVLAAIHLWFIGGSVALSVIGTYGLIVSRKWALVFTFFLVFAYVVVGPHPYYAILFVPLLVAGASYVIHAQQKIRHGLWLTIAGAAWVLWIAWPLPAPSPARATMDAIRESGIEGTILINGSFGHEWQYESPFEIGRFGPDAVENASIVVCLQPCEELSTYPEWAPLSEAPLEVFIKRR